jgi:hypothetical protein
MNGHSSRPRDGLRPVIHRCPFETATQFEVMSGGFKVAAVTDLTEPVEVDFGFESSLRQNPPVVIYSMKVGRALTEWTYAFDAWYRGRQPDEAITLICTLWYSDRK